MKPKTKQDIEKFIKHYEKQLKLENDPNEAMYLFNEIEKLKKKLEKLNNGTK